MLGRQAVSDGFGLGFSIVVTEARSSSVAGVFSAQIKPMLEATAC